MWITNYQDLTPECRGLAEDCGLMAESVMAGQPFSNNLRAKLVELSVKTKRTIELLTVRGEVWLNIRSGSQRVSVDCIKKMIALHKQYQAPVNESGEVSIPLRNDLRSQWNWLQ